MLQRRLFIFPILVAAAVVVGLMAVPTAQAAANVPPRLAKVANQTVSANQKVRIKLVGRDPDGGPKPLRYAAPRKPGWLKINKRTGVIRGTVPVSAMGRSFVVRATVTDGRATASRRFKVKVRANVAPNLAAIPATTATPGSTIRVAPNAADPDKAPRALSFAHAFAPANALTPAGTPAWLTVSPTTGVIAGTVPAGATGQAWNVTVTVSDGAKTATRTFRLAIGNQAPTLAAPGAHAVSVGDQFRFQLAGSDSDGPAPLTYRGDDLPAWLSLDAATGVVSGTVPASAAGKVFAPRFTAFDGALSSPERTLTLSVQSAVNRAPQFPADQRVSIAEGLTGAVATPRLNATDPDGDTLTWSILGKDASKFTLADGRLAAKGALDFETQSLYELIVQVSDGQLSANATVFVDVTDVDEAPAIEPIADVTTDEDVAVEPIAVKAIDPEGSPVTVAVTGLPAGLIYQGGRITGTPTVPGTYTVTVTATAGALSAAETFTITVTDVNDTPVIADQSMSVREGAAAGTVVGRLVATDDDGDDLTFSGTSPVFSVAPDGTVRVTDPGALTDGAGPFQIQVTVADGEKTATATLTIDLVDVEHPPVAQDATFEVAENAALGAVVGTLSASDADGDTISWRLSGPGSGDFAVDAATGQVRVASALDHETTPRYTLTATATAGADEDTATVTIEVTDVDEAPVIEPIADVSATEDAPLTPITVQAVDPEGDAVTVTVAGLPAGVTFDAGSSRITGTPAVDGEFEITVTATAGGLAAATTFVLTVTAVNDAPVLVPLDDVTVTEDTPIQPIRPAASDEDDTDLTFAVTGLPAGLTFADGQITGTPTVAGSFTVTVTVTDPDGAEDTDTFVLTVTNVNDAPVAGAASPAVVPATQGQALQATVTVPATDEDADPLTFTAAGLPAGVTATDNGTGVTLTGTPTVNGSFEVTITVADGNGGTDTATFTLQVAAAPAQACSRWSTLPCADIPVDLPFTAGFDGTDGGLDQTGFTMVDPPSLRTTTAPAIDQAPAPTQPTYADVPGYEPGLLDVVGGQLRIQATKGIQYRAPGQNPAATSPNALLNGLGVGVSGSTSGYDLTTTVVAPTFAGTDGAQQGGLWFGTDEDNYVKAVVSRVTATTNKVQLVREIGGVATPSTSFELNSAAFASGADVKLELQVVDTPAGGGSVQLYYTVGTGPRTLLVDNANTVDNDALSIPQTLLDGVDVGAGDDQSFAGLFASKRNAAATTPVTVAFADFAVAEHQVPNTAPVVAPIGAQSATEGAVFGPLPVSATDADGDPLTIGVAGLPLGLSFDAAAGTIGGTPSLGTAVGSPYTVTVTASDGRAQGTQTFALTVAPAGAPCHPISTLACSAVRVAAPVDLTFDGGAGGLDDTGFTMVQAPSARAGVDQAPAPTTPTTPEVPGFEPGLTSVSGGALTIQATKGIAYQKAPASTGSNSQLNALGVGLPGGSGQTGGYELATTLVAPTFPSSGAATTTQSQQAGLWFGLDEDNFVKLAVVRLTSTTSKVQLVKEVAGVASPGATYELNSAAFPAGQDVRLVLTVDAANGSPVVRASYAVGSGALTPLTDAANPASPALPVPAAFLAGAALPSGNTAPVTFAGVYATKRSAAATDAVNVRFADFAAEALDDGTPPAGPVDVKVDFTAETGTAAPGYLKDFGQPFGTRTGVGQGDGTLAYGWVKENSEETLSLVGNGRVRGRAGIDPRLDSVLHMQFSDVPNANCTTNVCEDGDWQLRVPEGVYDVTVAVGDQPGATSYDSKHAINVENQVLIEEFQGTAAKEFETLTGRVGVTDGELTINATGGTNTKIAYVEVRSADPANPLPAPFIVQTRPVNRSTGAPLGQGVASDLRLIGTAANPAPVESSTVNTTTVRLEEVVPGAPDPVVPGNANTSGGGDTINFQQTSALKPNTTYRFVVNGVKDAQGRTFVPFTSVFTTGTGDVVDPPGDFEPVTGVSFEKVDTGKNGKYFASLVVHNGFLWATTVGQGMFRYPINADGTLGAEQAINAFQGRAAIGLVFDKTDPNIAWVTNATANIGNESQAFGSKLTRVDFSASAVNPTLIDVFVNLPRSQKDHLSNSIAYGPGGNLYFLQGSNQAAGDPDGAWGNRGETLLSAAMLTFDPVTTWQRVQASGPIDVRTVDKGGSYDPFAAGAPLKIYATGIRNAYDLVYTENGHLYAPTNGTASGGNSPGVTAAGGTLTRTGQVPGENVTNVCATRRIDGTPYTAPSVPAVTNHNTQRDFLFDVEQGGYYGHPNPSRCEWVLNNGGLPEGAGSGGSKYAANVAPDRNYRGWAYDFEFNKSPNGVIQYRSNTFGGKLKGRLMVVRYSNFDDVLTLQQDANGQILGAQEGTTIGGLTGFDDPLDIVEDLEVNPGNLYVNSYDQTGGAPKLYLLRVPGGQQGSAVSLSTERLLGNRVTSAGSGALGTVTVTNDGTTAATVTGVTISGTGAAAYSRTLDATLPKTLAPGEKLTVQVAFDPNTEGVAAATLNIALASGSVPGVALRGLGTDGVGGSNEPSLQYIFDTRQLDIDTGDDNDATPDIHSNTTTRVDPLLGDSLDVELFKRAADGPVTVEPIAVFGPTDSNPVTQVSWYDQATPATANALFSASNSPASNGQTITPVTTGARQFDPGSATFGFVSRWPFFANRMVYSQDSLNTFAGAIGNHVRVYPLREGGRTVPNAYVVATEEHTSGWDYNDVVFVVRNVVPATGGGTADDAIKVNFQSEAAAVPAGYLKDFGQAYGTRTGADQGSGLSYGWINAATSAPEARTTSGRERNLQSDQRLDTFMHMQYQQQSQPNCTANNCNTGTWEIAVGNGTYRVTAAVGDPAANTDPESHQLSVEGVTLLDAPFVPSGAAGSAGHHTTGTRLVEVTDGRLTIAPTGTNTKIDYVEIEALAGQGDLIPPTVELATTGATDPSGAYISQATVAATIADRGGSNIEFVDWTLDGAAVPRPAGDRLVVTTPGQHTVRVTATDGAGNDTTTSATFSVVSGVLARIGIENRDAQRVGGQPVPGMYDDFLVMHRLNSLGTNAGHAIAVTHDTATLRLTNPDPTDALVISSLDLSAPLNPATGVRASTSNFSTPGTTLPLTIPAGGSYDLKVLFSGTGSRGIYGATMTIKSNAENLPSIPVQLRGFWQPLPENGTEPDLTQVARTFGYTMAIGEPLEDDRTGPLQGNEVRSNLWKRLDPSQPITARQLTALHGCCGETGDSIASPVTGAHDGAWGQSFFPRAAQSGNAPASAPFREGTSTRTDSFPITIAGYSTTSTGPLGIRMWPVEFQGKIVPGAYLVGQDFVANGCGAGSANCDYQDNIYLITNIAPVASADTTAPDAAPTGLTTTLSGRTVGLTWNPVSLADLGGYVVERQVPGSTTWTPLNTTPLAEPRLTDATAPSGTVTYRVVAVDTSGNRSPASATATATVPPPPQGTIRINAGGPAVTTGGVAWGAQQYGTGGKSYTNAVAIAGTTDDVLYQTEYSTSTGAESFDIPVPNGAYTVRLHFAEIYFGAPGGGTGGVGKRVFDVSLEGTLRLNDYDIFAEVGAATATVKSYPVTVTDGKVDLDLTSVVDQAKISAIEVIPA
ncbi:putative Ig domain-containing protein [Nocardioides sp. GXZ039]|uniref:putative Ig domain-containing protein n=1 Tax=Nocardioides sp. GXZ039 TaxID=3136018 RepID=UPI0030F3D541